ncbi:hypothetical protein L1987_43471 [Smallanthus sonchifolius]|uniref:Uncharacterized protein n=1 Tax=Smallanthus sonchifolius TaxID=185202 RepID=A0ACB9GLQ7_9ASTR|nr:hypothetical protein L1987_43471 [Smallanthus sonchifolius]
MRMMVNVGKCTKEKWVERTILGIMKFSKVRDTRTRYTVSLQQFISWYYDHETTKLVIEREEGQEDMRIYDANDLKLLCESDLIILKTIQLKCHRENEYDARHFLKVLKYLFGELEEVEV